MSFNLIDIEHRKGHLVSMSELTFLHPTSSFCFFSITLSLCGGKSLTCLNCGSHRVGSVVLMGIYGTQNKTQKAWIVYDCVYCSSICITKKCKCQSIRWAHEERILSSPSAVWDGRDPVALWLEERYVRLSIFKKFPIYCFLATSNAVSYLANKSFNNAFCFLHLVCCSRISKASWMGSAWKWRSIKVKERNTKWGYSYDLFN